MLTTLILLLLFIFIIFCIYPNKSLDVNRKDSDNLKKINRILSPI